MENPALQTSFTPQLTEAEAMDIKGSIGNREEESFPTNRELRDLNDLNDPNTPDSEAYQDQEDSEKNNSESGVTKTIKKPSFKDKKKYHTISDDLRQKLIDAVENDGQKIKHVAKKLNINYSSAKSICQVFKREGRLIKKTFKRRGPADASESGYGSSSYSNVAASSVDLSSINNMSQIEADLEPEKDNLQILKERLLQSRISSIKTTYQPNQGSNSAQQAPYSDFKLNSNDDPIKRLDSMIAQNSKILGEDFMPPSSSWKNQNSTETNNLTKATSHSHSAHTSSFSNAGSLTPDGSLLNGNIIIGNGNDIYQSRNGGILNQNQNFAFYSGQNMPLNKNDPGLKSNENNVNGQQNQNGFVYLQGLQGNSSQPPQQYFISNNNIQASPQQNFYNSYQPVIYYVPQGNNNIQSVQGQQNGQNQIYSNNNNNNNIGYFIQSQQGRNLSIKETVPNGYSGDMNNML